MADNLPGIELTGNETQDVNEIVRQAVAAEYKKLQNGHSQQSGNGEPTPEPAPQPIKVNLFGQEYSFENPEQLNAALATTFNQFQQQLEAQKAAANQPSQPSQPTNGFDRAKFAEMLDKDTLKGLDYAFGHLIFGQEVPNAAVAIRDRLQKADETRNMLAAWTFRNNHRDDFIPDQRAVQTLDQIRQGLNLPPDNAESWEVSLAVARERGLIPRPGAQAPTAPAPGQFDQQQHQQRFVPTPPPVGRTGNSFAGQAGIGNSIEETVAMAERLPLDQLEALVYKLAGQSKS